MPDSSTSLPVRDSPWPAVLIWIGAAACAAGLLHYRMWQVLSVDRPGASVLLAGSVAAATWILHRWRGWACANTLALGSVLVLVAMIDLLPALAVMLLVATAAALGSMLTGATRPLLATLTGLAMIAAMVGWSLPLPIHRWWIYLPLMVFTVAWRRHAVRAQISCCIAGWHDAVQAAPRAAALATAVLGLASTGAWLPTMQYDDLAYHLGVPWQLMLHGRYTLDPSHQVWALAPWAGDVLQAVAQVLARAEARGALNIVWFVASAAGLWQLGTLLTLRPPMRWAVLALFASLPLTIALLGGMQTETVAVAITIALALLIVDDGARGDGGDAHPVATNDVMHRLLCGALLFGMLCALKPMHAVAALPLLAWAGWRWRRGTWSRIPALIGALLVMLAVAGSSYVYAWSVTGNPVLPLFNDVFGSPYFTIVSFDDPRWHRGFGFGLIWNLSFDTDQYLEGSDGGVGFVLMALAGAWLLAIFDNRARGLAICASLAILLPLAMLQYARYIHPGMVLLLPALVLAVQRWLPRRNGVLLLAALCLLNVAFQANAHWMLKSGTIWHSILVFGRDAPLLSSYVPERVLAAMIREHAPDSGPVLNLSTPYHAEFAGRGRTVDWYAPALFTARHVAESDASGGGWATLLWRERIAEVILRPTQLSDPQRAGLLLLGARRERVVGDAEWWRIPAQARAP